MNERALAVLVLAGLVAYLVTRPAVDEDGEDDDSPDLEDYANQIVDGVETAVTGENDMNRNAFLGALTVGEGTADSMGYYRLCGGGNADNLDDHPANQGWRGWQMPAQMAINAGFPGGVAFSTAAGRYQITKPTWNRVAQKLGLQDFSEASQDAAAWYLIGEKGAQADVMAGRLSAAVVKLGKVWASLPGAAAQQRQVSLANFSASYVQNGGVLA